MKFINKIKNISFTFLLLITIFSLVGCSSSNVSMSYYEEQNISLTNTMKNTTNTISDSFAKNLCIETDSVSSNDFLNLESSSMLLCDLKNNTILYNKDAYTQLDPASLTKVMTAIIALKYGKLDDILTASENVLIEESGASLVGIKPGDKLTLDQALHALLIPSGNDAAVLIAEYIANDLDSFNELMNKEAKLLGATKCNFMNPHGLTAENHYVTAYDMYLIFNEAIKYDEFLQIISTTNYSSIYYDENDNPKELSFKTTNWFLTGNQLVPDGIIVLGGKTGTTKAAGNCLVLLSKNTSGNPFISVILKSDQRDLLYEEMSHLINLENTR